MRLGPNRAPSSPPDTPEPTKSSPLSVNAFSRRTVSVHSALPPSMRQSPVSSSGVSESTTASVPGPALTRITMRRGRLIDLTKSAGDAAGMIAPPGPMTLGGLSAVNCSVTLAVRL
jgi:hypothetical protein